MTNEDQTYIAVDTTGKAISRRSHLFQDCSFIKEETTVRPISTAEMALLGLRVCSVCERRQTGGPAIEVLKEYLDGHNDRGGPEDTERWAWELFNLLKERGFYLAQRKSK